MADPRVVKRWVCDEYEKAVAAQPQGARDINDFAAIRGYPRAKEIVEGVDGAVVHGNTEREREQANSWRRARFEVGDDAIIPWCCLVATAIRKLKKKGSLKIAASLRACMEGVLGHTKEIMGGGKNGKRQVSMRKGCGHTLAQTGDVRIEPGK